MARRHAFRPGDWETIATRLDEIICAHTGEDPFEEALKLLVAMLASETRGQESLADTDALRAINRLLADACQRWPGILEPGTNTRLSGPALGRCAALLRTGSLLQSDLVGLDTMFEFIVNKASKGQKGQYFTPRYVVDAAVRMVAPGPGELVVDPACGSGAFLRRAVMQGARVWGFDQDPRAVRVARVMMAASQQPVSLVQRLDSLRRPALEDIVHASMPGFQGFDVVVTNPPFAGDAGDELRSTYMLGRGRRVERDILFIERCIELLRPGGRMAIVLPHNKVGGAQWAFVREWLLCRARVAAVIGLGRNTFQPHTSQKACILIAVKRPEPLPRPPRSEEIVFFISERDGKDQRGRLVLRGPPPGAIDHDLDEAIPPVRKALLAEAG